MHKRIIKPLFTRIMSAHEDETHGQDTATTTQRESCCEDDGRAKRHHARDSSDDAVAQPLSMGPDTEEEVEDEPGLFFPSRLSEARLGAITLLLLELTSLHALNPDEPIANVGARIGVCNDCKLWMT